MKYMCPICNYDGLYDPPYTIQGYGSDEICPCCGFQFGCDDYPNKEEAQRKWRERWIKNGCHWYSKSRLPQDGWDPKKQVQGLTRDD